jgi:glycine/D-amino acid oxidase-like deaminating enzyme
MKMPDYDRRPYWHATTPSGPDFGGRPLPDRADVVVVGGGYTGLVAALCMARAGAVVTLLEKESLGWGASTRNGGIFHPGLKWGRAALERRYGPELGPAVFQAGVDAYLEAECFVQDERIDCDLRRTGLAVMAWSSRHLPALARELAEFRQAGLSGRMVDGDAVQEEIGSQHYPGGMVLEESSAIHPGRYFTGLVKRAVAAGVDLHTGVAAQRLARQRMAGGTDVVTDRGTIRARDVLVATNGYTDGLVPWLRQRVMPIGSYIVATEPMSEELALSVSPRGRTFFDSKNFLYYWHVNPERRLIFGGRASFRGTSIERTAAILTVALAQVHPQAAGLRIDHAWGGNVGFTFDRLPHLGEHDGVHFALGYCGSGLALGTAFGIRMAGRLGRGSEMQHEPWAFERIGFPAAPLLAAIYRGQPWFLPAAGEWFRFADWWARRGTGAQNGHGAAS